MNSSLIADDILSKIPITDSTNKILIGYSGGVDSHVLLYMLAQMKDSLSQEIEAIHINHGLNDMANEWVKHCRSICLGLEIKFLLVELDAKSPKGESQEAWARKLRYEAINQFINDGDILLTAHNKNDTAETLLLQLFRGAGPAGLSAMSLNSPFGAGWHCRPLLDYSRSEIEKYADNNNLEWIEDSSNKDNKYDRNFLRNNVIPILTGRWPGMSNTLSRASRIQAETSMLLQDLASVDLEDCILENSGQLSITALNKLSNHRVANVIRYWIKNHGYAIPTSAQMTRIIEDVLNASSDSEPCISWSDTEVRRYRDTLFISSPLPKPPDSSSEICWKLDEECNLVMGKLHAQRSIGKGIKAKICPENFVTVKFRRGSEVIKKGGHHHKLKKLFQEFGVPSYYRDFIPLIYIGDKLVAISGLLIDEDYIAAQTEESIDITWSRPDGLILC